MGFITQFHTWVTGEVITAARLNGNISNLVDGLDDGTKDINVNLVQIGGTEIVNASRAATFTDLDVDNINVNGNTISSTDSNGNVVVAPNGTGDVQLDADTVRVGDSNVDVTVTTNGTGDLTLSTNAGTDSGVITIADAANGNIAITPDGTGEVDISKVDIDGGAIDGTIIGASAAAAITGTTIDGDTITGTTLTDGTVTLTGGKITPDLDVDNININGNTIISTDTNGDITLSPNGTGTVVIDTDLDVDNININGNTIISTDTNGDINLTPDGTGNLVLNGQVIVEINIGDWNMDTTTNVDVAHSLSATEYKTIRQIEVIIRDDADSVYYDLEAVQTGAGGPSEGGISQIGSTNINLVRRDLGLFDSASFDSTSYNRGFITILYTPD